ncbi:MAG TPA: polyprenyl diphosphate synthase, partial [Candidatus Eremiobacteraceae bacterium]|nr:polyprenyl diphosphate synthase [Candidatus Eremiobacteraceae bacterium]
MSARDRKLAAPNALDPQRMPRHVAVIMDGNRRWARERRLPAIEGHRRGVLALRELVRGCSDLGIPIVTVYAFSTENWKREALEISLLLDLLVQFAKSEEAELNRNGVRVRGIGRINGLPPHQRGAIEELERRTNGNDRVTLNIAINYSARSELADAARAIAAQVRDGSLAADDVDESVVEKHLYTAHAPDPDILIRTGGELRLSNFLLWQVAYTEIWVTERYWPDFG